MLKRDSKGFTLIELLIVVAIIGIIAAIAIPNLLNAIDRGKQKRTMADMRSIGTAVESYAVDNNVYPVATTAADPQDDRRSRRYMKNMPSTDGWNNTLPGGVGDRRVHDLLRRARTARAVPARPPRPRRSTTRSASPVGSSSATRRAASSKTISIG